MSIWFIDTPCLTELAIVKLHYIVHYRGNHKSMRVVLGSNFSCMGNNDMMLVTTLGITLISVLQNLGHSVSQSYLLSHMYIKLLQQDPLGAYA